MCGVFYFTVILSGTGTPVESKDLAEKSVKRDFSDEP